MNTGQYCDVLNGLTEAAGIVVRLKRDHDAQIQEAREIIKNMREVLVDARPGEENLIDWAETFLERTKEK